MTVIKKGRFTLVWFSLSKGMPRLFRIRIASNCQVKHIEICFSLTVIVLAVLRAEGSLMGLYYDT